MPWPPIIPPANRANATVMSSSHPTDHNQTSAALTEIVNRVDTGPRGLVGRVLAATDQSGITSTVVDMTGYVVTFTSAATRTYRVSFHFASLGPAVAGHLQVFYVQWDGGANTVAVRQDAIGSGQTFTHSGFTFATVAAGSHTVKLRAFCSAASMTILNQSQMNGHFAVEDVGP